MVVVLPTGDPFSWSFNELPYSVGMGIRQFVPQKYRSYSDKVLYVHKKYVPQVVVYILLKTGKVNYTSLPDDMQLEVSKYKKDHECLVDAVPSNPYTILHLLESAPEYILEAVWRAILKNEHPDVGGNSDNFLRLKNAYEAIKRHH
jgi:hypothetical protein